MDKVINLSYSEYVRLGKSANYGKNPNWRLFTYNEWFYITVHGYAETDSIHAN